MAYHPTVLSQLLQSVPRLEFEKLAQAHDGSRRSDALSRWSQFIALAVGHLGQRHSLRDIEAGSRVIPSCTTTWDSAVSRSALARANETLSADFYRDLFQVLYARLQKHTPCRANASASKANYSRWMGR